MSLKSVFQRKNRSLSNPLYLREWIQIFELLRSYDSDSTGYSSSSDVSSPLSGSQFILRSATGQSICSNQSLYHTVGAPPLNVSYCIKTEVVQFTAGLWTVPNIQQLQLSILIIVYIRERKVSSFLEPMGCKIKRNSFLNTEFCSEIFKEIDRNK